MKNRFRFISVLIWIAAQALAQQSSFAGIGDKPPELHLNVIRPIGTEVGSWESLKGRVVILDFWATWCSPCIKAFPHLNGLVQEFADQDVVFISLTYEPPEITIPFLDKHSLKTIVADDTSFQMFRSFDAWAIPQVLLVNRDGFIAGRLHPDYLTADVIKTVLAGHIPEVKQAPTDMFDPAGAEEHFRSLLKRE